MPNPRRPIPVTLTTVSLFALLSALPALGQERGLTYNLYGAPGLIEMPTAFMAGDGRLATTLSYYDGTIRATGTFQIAPGINVALRYSGIDDYVETYDEAYLDRSLDVRFRLTEESGWMPSVSVGLVDFLGTGVFSSEYIVGTKTVGDNFRITGGLGWGRLGTGGSFDNPLAALFPDFDERPPVYEVGGEGGDLSLDAYFRGDAAFFGGIEYAHTEELIFKAEYSSDDGYIDFEREDALIDRRIPLNFGVNWRPNDNMQFGLAYLYGSTIAFSGTLVVDPTQRLTAMMDAPPLPVIPRPETPGAAATWGVTDRHGAVDRLEALLRPDGLHVISLSVEGSTARVRFQNERYRADAQAVGRVARGLSHVAGPEIDTFVIEPMRNGIPLSAVTIRRADLERYENVPGGSDAILASATISDVAPGGDFVLPSTTEDRFRWNIAPDLNLIVFGARQAVRPELWLTFNAEYEVSPQTVVTGRLRYRLLGETPLRELDPTALHRVRTNWALYDIEGDPGIENLYVAHYARPAENVFARLSAGYLETMYGGVSAEVLWAPPDSRLAVGAELNYVAQRDFDMMFGFQDYEVATGHVSVYYDMPMGVQARVDAGRYLAGDWGATFAVNREFDNGWAIGGFVTLTDVSVEDFGQGSFDKGIHFTMPIDYLFGRPTRQALSSDLVALRRDGGARLEVPGRLYDIVSDAHSGDLTDSWGRFWR